MAINSTDIETGDATAETVLREAIEAAAAQAVVAPFAEPGFVCVGCLEATAELEDDPFCSTHCRYKNAGKVNTWEGISIGETDYSVMTEPQLLEVRKSVNAALKKVRGK